MDVVGVIAWVRAHYPGGAYVIYTERPVWYRSGQVGTVFNKVELGS